MDDLLRNNFTAYYKLPVCKEANLSIKTNEIYFEIEDKPSREIALHTSVGKGMARFSNPNALSVIITNYDKFVTSLPIPFQKGKMRCDILVCDNGHHLILGELKDSPNIRQHRKKAKKQLMESLRTLLVVPEFLAIANEKKVKKCCYFNKQISSPPLITATNAFNRLSTIFDDGFKMSHKDIEQEQFEFWEYLGGQTLKII